MEVVGYGRNSSGQFQVIVQQPFIQGNKMADEEIRLYVEKLGYKLVSSSNWTYATERIYLSDMHDENVIRSSKGNVFVVDCDIRINTPELRIGGRLSLSHYMKFVDI